MSYNNKTKKPGVNEKQQVGQKEPDKKQLQKQLNELKEHNEQLATEVNANNTTIDALQNNLMKAKSALRMREQDIRTLKRELQSCSAELSVVHQQYSKRKRENTTLRKKLERCSAELSVFKTKELMLKRLQNSTDMILTGAINTLLKEKNNDFQFFMKNAEMSEKKLQVQLSEAEDKLICAKKTIDEHLLTIADLQKTKKRLARALKKHEKHDLIVRELKCTIMLRDEEIKSQQRELKQFTYELYKPTRSQVQYKHRQDNSLQEELDTTRIELNEERKETRRQNHVIEELETQVAKLAQQNYTLKSREKAQHKEDPMKDKLIRDLNFIVSKLENELRQQMAKNERFVDAKYYTNTNLVNLKSQLKTLQSEHKTLQSELKIANVSKSKLKEKLALSDSVNKRLRFELEQTKRAQVNTINKLQREKRISEYRCY